MADQKKAGFVKMHHDVFQNTSDTRIYWICNGGVLINSRGTCILIDPLLKGFDMPLLVPCPLNTEEVEYADSILITHCDNDHFSRTTIHEIKDRCKSFHTTQYVASLFKEEGIQAIGHDIHKSFMVNDVKISLTPADHAWQNEKEKYAALRTYRQEDFCGFWIETVDGTIWMPGDSRLLQEQLEYPQPDVILLDISNSKWHLGHQNLPKLANAYPDSTLIPIHWGCVSSTMPEFNADPQILNEKIRNPERIRIQALGEPYSLRNDNEK